MQARFLFISMPDLFLQNLYLTFMIKLTILTKPLI